ncbi:MAG: DUF945 family protein [Pseudomonadota bacterium]
MRKWGIVGLLLLLMAAAWPLIVGMLVERTVTEAHAAQLGGSELRHEMLDYQRGYLGATGRSRLVIEEADRRFVIELTHRVRHGLLGARGNSEVDLDALEAPPGSPVPHLLRSLDLQIHTRSGLTGGVTARAAFDALRLDLNAIPEFAEHLGSVDPVWLELGSGQGRFAWSAEQILLSLDVPELRLSDRHTDLRLEQARYVTVFKADPDGVFGLLPDYEGGLGAARVALTTSDGVLELQRPRMDFLQSTHAELMDSHARLQLDAARLQSGSDEVLALQALDLRTGMLRWHRPTLVDLVAQMQALEARALEPDQRNALIGASVAEALQAMIEDRPALTLRLSLNEVPARQVELDSELGLRGTRQDFATRPLETLALDMRLGLGLEWADAVARAWPELELDAWLQSAAAQGWLRRDDEARQWRGHLEVEGGRVRVNGEDRTAALMATLFALAGGMF